MRYLLILLFLVPLDCLGATWARRARVGGAHSRNYYHHVLPGRHR